MEKNCRIFKRGYKLDVDGDWTYDHGNKCLIDGLTKMELNELFNEDVAKGGFDRIELKGGQTIATVVRYNEDKTKRTVTRYKELY